MPVRLTVVEGPSAGTVYFLGEGESKVFGRATSADVRIADALLSRHHVMVRGTAAGGLVLDLDSSNGTFLNGRLVKEAPLDTGDRIKIGNVVFQVHLEQPTAPGAGDKVPTVRALMFCTRCYRGVVLGDRQLPPWEAFVCDACRRTHAPLDTAVLAGYTLLEKVGEDPRGPIYRAEQNDDQRLVLLRFFAPTEGSVDTRMLDLFLREAEIAAGLDHPNIVETVDAGEQGGVYFIAEEWIAGPSLGDRLKRAGGLMPLDEALHVASRIAAALEYAYDHGIVHRSVRPSTIHFSGEGGVKLGDFGLAKPIAGTTPSGIAKASAWHGEANYLPPEQLIAASTVDQRADVYALGATIYHMACGKPPFDAPTPMRVVRRIGEGDLTPLAELAPGAPKALVGLVERCMEREAARRFQTPHELAGAIEACRAKVAKV
jgi:pSer/pThr/pTyr-binding forkhead associated (FHA) protein